MAKDEIILDGRDLMRSITLGVRLPRAFGFRMWLGTKLFELAGVVTGTTVLIEFDDEATG